MSTVAVFADDATTGHLPMVCVRTGEPAEVVQFRELPIGPSQWVWLLVLLGPIGWIVQLAKTSGSETRTVGLPLTRAAAEPGRRQRRMVACVGGAAVILSPAVLLVWDGWPPVVHTLFWGVEAVLVGTWIRLSMRYGTGRIGVQLEASGRWFTLSGVHPNFAAAVRAERSRRTVERI